MNPCPVCGTLRAVETSFYKYAAPQYDRPLPAAAARLQVVPDPEEGDPEKRHVRCCPQCGALFTYRCSYEYHVNGSEDEEELALMDAGQAAAWVQGFARRLQALRRRVEQLEGGASQEQALAAGLRRELEAWSAGLQPTCPAVLDALADLSEG